MQVCKNCGREIKFIAQGVKNVICCNAEETKVITETGREVKGYTVHKCGEKNERKAD